MMPIPSHEIVSRQKVGLYKGDPVYELRTKGGLFLVACAKKAGGAETLGAGSHRAIARHLAERKGATITILQKSEDVPAAVFAHLLPDAIKLTEMLRAKERELG